MQNSTLTPTDWYVVRKSEVGTAFSDEITAYRTAVRTCYGNLKTAINAASDIDELLFLFMILNLVHLKMQKQ